VSPRAATVVERFRATFVYLDALDLAEQDQIVAALVADLRSRRPMSIAPLSVLPAPTEKIRDPRVP
jgi:hypothetical protein